ncbi:hypothetical protein [Paenibacillus sedimenti]|uniref:Uncharacterized protein n=1 Tax=Paenibacillus sedimenti TaxID=2770274 RepID=A0A926QIH4_9BACL|nr:hypothetical protein [Paenibacillus sedimenti]MBD0379618.1 hypothetical protein [Paenibacillus sedimenti]
MKKEDLIMVEELNMLLADLGEEIQNDGTEEPVSAQRLISLQKAVMLLSKQVMSLQDELHEHSQSQHRQQEQLFRQLKLGLERKLDQQWAAMMEQHWRSDSGTEQNPQIAGDAEAAPKEERLAPEPASAEEPAPTYSRVKSYRKIRKRRKSFIEKLFE